MKTLANKLFVVAFFVILLAGMLRTVLIPKDINSYENRYANKLPELTLSGFLDKSFQNGTDDALMDQFPLAQTGKKLFNRTSMLYKSRLTDVLLKTMFTDQYVNMGGMLIFGGVHYVFAPFSYEDNQAALENRINGINRMVQALPDTDFYAYYIEKETDIYFTNNAKMNVGDRVLSQINLPEANKAIFRVDSFQQFDREFFRTDTHWNHEGSYRAYCEVLQWLMPQEQPLTPLDSQLVCETFSGNKASTNGAEGIWQEPFYAYAYAFPQMEYTVNGQKAGDYGRQNQFHVASTSYGAYYGGDEGEIIFRNPSGNGKSYLFIGESYDNAILKLLASHASNLYSIDLRTYENYMGKTFSIAQYLKDHEIDAVVLIGNMDYYRLDSFHMEVAE